MFDNHVYNLMRQMVEEHTSLWRIRDTYEQDAGDCAACKAFWNKLENDKEQHIEDLSQLIKNHT